MAKGGSRGRRSYTRDARGRFASTPGGGAKPKPPRTSFRQRQAVSLARSRGQTGRLGSATKAAKARLKATKARTGAGASPQQKAALTRAKRMAAALAGERRVKTAGRAGILRGVAAKGVKKAAGARVRPGVAPAKQQKPVGKVDMKRAISRAIELRQQARKLQAQGEALMSSGRRDRAIANVPLGSRARRAETNRGIRGAQLVARAATLNNRAERVLERAVASRKKAEREAAKPARAPRSVQSLRLSRAKQIEKRRSINITNPAGWREDGAAKMAANAARTQQRALAFYKQQQKAKKAGGVKGKAVASKPAAPPRPTSKVVPRSERRKVAGPRKAGVVAKPKGLKPGALSAKARTAPRAQFDLAAWQRRAARVKSIGIRRANIESGANDFEKELRKVQRAYATQVNAERFLKELTRDRRDPSGKTLVRGGDALRANFDARPRRSTASTPRGVAARNRIYDQERKDKRAANKAAREAKAAAKKATVKPAAKTLRVIRMPKQANRIGFAKMPRETAKALQPFLRDLPTVPTRRKPDYVQSGPGGNLKTFYLSNEQPRRATAKQIASIKKAMSGWAHQSSGLGHRQSYSRIFYGMGGSNESVRVTITRKGGPLAGGQVEVTRSVTSKGGRRGGGSLAERAAGLPRKPRISSVPRRRRKPAS